MMKAIMKVGKELYKTERMGVIMQNVLDNGCFFSSINRAQKKGI
jgi:hypothetical protein